MENVLRPIKQGLGTVFNTASNICNATAGVFNRAAQMPYYQQSVFYGAPWGCYHGLGGFAYFPYTSYPFGCACSPVPFNGLGIYNEPTPQAPDFSIPTPVPSSGSAKSEPKADYTGAMATPLNIGGFQDYESPFMVPIYGTTTQELENFIRFGTLPQSVAPYNYQRPAMPFAGNAPQFNGNSNAAIADYYLHPEKYQRPNTNSTNGTNNNQAAKQQSESQIKREKRTDATMSNLGLTEHEYFSSLKEKREKGTLNSQEQKLYDFYLKMYNDYSIIKDDGSGGISQSNAGSIASTKITRKLDSIIANASSIDALESIIKECTPEEIAAIEFHWSTYVQGYPELKDKTFRAMLKDSANWWGFKWTNWNSESFEKLSDYIDEKTFSISPRSIAYSLLQHTQNVHIGGIGIDRTRVINILNKIKGKPELIEAVRYEFAYIAKQNGVDAESAFSSITGSRFVFDGSETARTAKEVLKY